MALTAQEQLRVLTLLDIANDILSNSLETDELDNQENILCPLGEVVSNVQNLETDG